MSILKMSFKGNEHFEDGYSQDYDLDLVIQRTPTKKLEIILKDVEFKKETSIILTLDQIDILLNFLNIEKNDKI